MAFRSPNGVFCHQVMPFGLKNIGATYQRALTVFFKKMLGGTLECYLDDLVVKSRRRLDT